MCMTSIGIYQELLQERLAADQRLCVMYQRYLHQLFLCVCTRFPPSSEILNGCIYAVQKIYITDMYKQTIHVCSYMLMIAV